MFEKSYVKDISYRTFDKRAIYYSKEYVERDRYEVMKNFIDRDNLALFSLKRMRKDNPLKVFLSKAITDKSYISSLDNGYTFPLYLYPDENTQTNLLESKDEDKPTRTPNLDHQIVADIAKAIDLTFTNEKEATAGTFAPIDILDYIYAVLHSPTYCETYKEFLKIDFPRVPYPSDADTFWQLVALGSDLRQIHLLESPKLAVQVKALSVGYPINGDNCVTRKMTKTSIGFEPNEADNSIGKVWLNDTQYFTNVPLVAWEFYIGGYQPAQKWLKDRRDRTLDHHDIKHYMNIIASLSLTNELMQQIDNINVTG
ncbi:type ISP restriction/modification enzyme [uncultured Psychrobacter sp.]|uniref:type ISP restriction/modification enzyme n=1 Tax=uncultured Psychrobacter sp. TaxID=259303 RepID=UPI002605D2A3|nr:type ISP restriction/modification enzyme [uncultured Psychrobacter sp.]